MTVIVLFSRHYGKSFAKSFTATCTEKLSSIRSINGKELRRLPISTVEQLITLSESELRELNPGKSIKNFYYSLKKRLRVSQKRLHLKLTDMKVSAKRIINLIIQPFLIKSLAHDFTRVNNKKARKEKSLKTNKFYSIRNQIRLAS